MNKDTLDFKTAWDKFQEDYVGKIAFDCLNDDIWNHLNAKLVDLGYVFVNGNSFEKFNEHYCCMVVQKDLYLLAMIDRANAELQGWPIYDYDYEFSDTHLKKILNIIKVEDLKEIIII